MQSPDEEARAAREKRLNRLRLYAVALVEAEEPGYIPLGELLHEMQRVERSDEAISEALSSLQSFGKLYLTAQRNMMLGANAKTPPTRGGVSKRPVYSFTEDGDGMATVTVTSDAGEFQYLIPTAPIDL